MNNSVELLIRCLHFVAENVYPAVPSLPASPELVKAWNQLHLKAVAEKPIALELLSSPEVRLVVEKLKAKTGLAKPYNDAEKVPENWTVRLRKLKESLEQYEGERWVNDLYAWQYKNPYPQTARPKKKKRIVRQLKRSQGKARSWEPRYSLPPRSSKMDEYHKKTILAFVVDLQQVIADETFADVSKDSSCEQHARMSEKELRLIVSDPVVRDRMWLLINFDVDENSGTVRLGHMEFSGLNSQALAFFKLAKDNWPLSLVMKEHDLRHDRIAKGLPDKLQRIIDKDRHRIDVAKLRQILTDQ